LVPRDSTPKEPVFPPELTAYEPKTVAVDSKNGS